jgi:hypothetical protein
MNNIPTRLSRMRRSRLLLRAVALSAVLLAGAAGHAQPLAPPAPLGMAPGASRQAWAAAAALSRGIGLAAALDPPPMPPQNAGDLPGTVAKAGFRSVRLAVQRASLDPEVPDAAAVQARLHRLDGVIDAFLSRGVLVVLDIRGDGPPHAGGGQSAAQGAGQAEARRRRFVGLWRRVAERYAARPQRLLFEVSFEPGAAAAEKNELLARAVKDIRLTNPKRVLVVGWDDAIGLPQLALPGDGHLIVGVGNAEPYRFTRQGVPGLPESEKWRGTGCCSPQERQLMALPLDVAKAWSVEHRYPVWLGEFMSYQDIPMDLRARHARFMRQAAEERGFSWAYGDLASGFGAYDPVARAWHQPLLEALLGP